MAEISWYLLEKLADLRDFLRRELPNCFIVHLLATYPPGEQQYGREYFQDIQGIKDFFGMHYLESGEIRRADDRRRTWFLGTWRDDVFKSWE
jgi:hypothetical protein